ncbi:MAG: hypothetical protein V1875_05915 [Candidatus Altiarchaeota archaeon]
MLFKLSMMGVFFALIMMVIGIFYPFNAILVPFPMAWLLGILAILPSITVYYEVKEKFWAEVEESSKKK